MAKNLRDNVRWRRIQSSIWVIFPSFVTEFTPTPQRQQHLQLTRRTRRCREPIGDMLRYTGL